MNYATTYHNGKGTNIHRKKAKATAQTASGICIVDAETKRCRGNTKGQAEIGSFNATADGFLRTKILPKLRVESDQQSDKTAKLQKDFYRSLARLAKHYQGFTPSENHSLAYPYNIAFSLSETKTFLKDNVKYWSGIKIVQDSTKTFLMSEERFSTGSTLYYIPIIPLHLMLKDKNYKRTAHLLLSVCSYLYHVADIPYYRQEGSYLYWQYDMLKEWMETDDEVDLQDSYYKEFRLSECIGDDIEKKLYNLKNLDFFENRLQKFKAKDSFQSECLDLSESVFQFYKKYPNEKYSRNANVGYPRLENEEDECDENDIVSMEMYVSFYAHSRDRLSDNLFDTLNINFGEMEKMEEPSIFRAFDDNPLTDKNLDFEEQLFDIIDKLIYLLNDYNDNYHG